MDATKTMVRSVLTSSPTSLTVDQLCREYKAILGENIPFKELGYNSVEHFLRDIPDTVQLAGSGRYATVNLVFSEKSAHIAQMVSKQKLTKKKGVNYQRRTVIVPAQQEKAYVNRRPVTTQRIVYPPAKPSNPSTQNNVKLNSTDFRNPSTQNTVTLNSTDFRNPSTQNNVKLNSSDFRNCAYGPPSPSTSEGSSACASSPEQYKPNVRQFEYKNNNIHTPPKPNIQSVKTPKSNLAPVVRRNKSLSQNNFDAYQQAPRNDISRDNKKPALTKNNLFSLKEEEENVPNLIKNNLRLIIKQYPEGVWCTELPNIYRKTFKRELKYFELGFKSLIELCMYLKSIFHWVRPGQDDFRLYDKSKPLPVNAEKNFTVASYTKPTENNNIRLENALPPLDWDDVLSFLPQNILQPGDEISRYFVPPETTENDIIDVVVGEICDASKFWVYPDNGKLDQLMDEMQVFYKKRGEKYKVPKELIRKGLYCASIIFGEYHRALVTEVMNHGKNKIFYIDYGTIRTETSELYFLHNHFSELPAQTLRCRLAGICPVIKGAPWSPESTAEFRSLTKKSNFVAKIARIKWEDQILEVFLADVRVPRVFYINDRLVEKGHAVFIDQEQKTIIVDSLSTQIVSNLHLFPTFVELEHGLAPSCEMDLFYNMNVPLKFCYPQYFDTDYTNEELLNEERFMRYENMLLKAARPPKLHFSRTEIADFEDKSIMWEYFGELRKDIEHSSYNPDGAQEIFGVDELTFHNQEQNQNDSLDNSQTKVLNDVKFNRLLSENILKEITSISTYSDVSAEDLMAELDNISEAAESCKSVGIQEAYRDLSDKCSDTTKLSKRNHQDQMFSTTASRNGLDYDSDAYPDLSVANMTLHDSQYAQLSNRTEYYADKLSQFQVHHEDRSSEKYSEKSVATKISEISYTKKQASTNPFLNDDENAEQIARLHPTNPFLNFLETDKEPSDETFEVSTSASCDSGVEIHRKHYLVDNTANLPIVHHPSIFDALQFNQIASRTNLDVNAVPFFPTFNYTAPVHPYYGYNLPTLDPTVYCNPYYQRTPTQMAPTFTQQPQLPSDLNRPKYPPPPPGFAPK